MAVIFWLLVILSLQFTRSQDLPRKRGGFLWKIDVEPPSYLFGTMHIDYKLLIDHILPEFEEAFEQVDHFYTESEPFSDLIQLGKAKEREMPSDFDGYLERRAEMENKVVGGMENIIQMLQNKDFLREYHAATNPNEVQPKAYVRKGIFDAYINGDEEKILEICREAEGISDRERERYKLLKRKILKERNHKMAERIKMILDGQSGSHMFAFGARHFMGDSDNVVDLLRKARYKVERL